MQVPFAKRTLENGLDVIVHEDHGCPIVAVNVWYHVGSKNERVGLTGFAHLFEHLMFEGSLHHDRGYFHPLEEAGGALNGSTSADRTNYWEVVPTGAIERALWLESDRMGYLLPALTAEKFETQRSVVLNERRQRYENQPYGMASIALMAELFAAGHPYHWPTIGEPADLEAATLDDARRFCRTHYHPANASLVVAGAIDSGAAFDLVEQYFAEIPAGVLVPDVNVPAAVVPAKRRRVAMEDRVELPRVYLAWRTPPLFARGDAELDLLALMLAGGQASRLHRRLVRESRLATDVSAGQGSRELAGTFTLVATAAPGQSLDAVEAILRDEVARLSTEGPAEEELRRCQTVLEADVAFRLQGMGGFGGRADQLNAYNVYVGDPAYFDADLRRYLNATVADIQAAARTLLDQDPVTLSIVPHGKQPSALPGSVFLGAP